MRRVGEGSHHRHAQKCKTKNQKKKSLKKEDLLQSQAITEYKKMFKKKLLFRKFTQAKYDHQLPKVYVAHATNT